jgi:sulfane dehydrogenase subunit SoxC
MKRNTSGRDAASSARNALSKAGRVRRALLRKGASAAAAAAGLGIAAKSAAQSAAIDAPPWMRTPGEPMRAYGSPAKAEEPVRRVASSAYAAVTPGAGASRTPLQSLRGTITPSGLHFERHHNSVPAVDPLEHTLLIHGMVARPLKFTLRALDRYPMVSRTCFIECAGNSGPNTLPKAPAANAQAIHGLVSCSEWTGVPLAILLHEAGIDAKAGWLLVEGADAVAMSRSVPVDKALDDALVALYQNGERIRPEQGYPMRLLLPGWEGNMNVKWLRRIKATDAATHTKDETSKYTDLQRDGRSRQFTFVMDVKSLITSPSAGSALDGPGLYEISGIAWSGAGRIARVEVSTDGGASWRDAQIGAPVLAKSLTRFSMPWRWDGAPAHLQSRATDERGNVQPSRAAWNALYSAANRYHNNMIQTWAVAADGSVANVYA